MNTTTNAKRLDLVKKSHLARKVGNHEHVCIFTARGETVRVYAYGTHTDHVNDQTVSREQARATWRALLAQGYRRTLPVDVVLPSA
jgi:hypothetical protein